MSSFILLSFALSCTRSESILLFSSLLPVASFSVSVSLNPPLLMLPFDHQLTRLGSQRSCSGRLRQSRLKECS